jgi:hypothetical protein
MLPPCVKALAHHARPTTNCRRINPAPCHGARLNTHHPTQGLSASSRPHAVLGTLTQPHAMRPHPTATCHSTHTNGCAQSCNPNPKPQGHLKRHEGGESCKPTEGWSCLVAKATPTQVQTHTVLSLHMHTQGFADMSTSALLCNSLARPTVPPYKHHIQSQGGLHPCRPA